MKFSSFARIKPMAMTLNSGVLTIAGQIAVAGTIVFGSVSSTFLLQLVTQPYVTALHEVFDVGQSEEQRSNIDTRKFCATRLNVLGNPKKTVFTLRDVSTSKHPFASFSIKSEGEFYMYRKDIVDESVRLALTKE